MGVKNQVCECRLEGYAYARHAGFRPCLFAVRRSRGKQTTLTVSDGGILTNLQYVYADTVLLFYDPLGGDRIGAVWQPNLRDARPFRVLGGFSSTPLRKVSDIYMVDPYDFSPYMSTL